MENQSHNYTLFIVISGAVCHSVKVLGYEQHNVFSSRCGNFCHLFRTQMQRNRPQKVNGTKSMIKINANDRIGKSESPISSGWATMTIKKSWCFCKTYGSVVVETISETSHLCWNNETIGFKSSLTSIIIESTYLTLNMNKIWGCFKVQVGWKMHFMGKLGLDKVSKRSRRDPDH